MRTTFRHELDQLHEQLIGMLNLVEAAMGRATAALLDPDRALAEQVLAEDATIDALRAEIDERVLTVLATQQPVAADLRVLVAALRMSGDLERMGDLARHVAETALLRYPESVVPADLRSLVRRMSVVAQHLVSEVRDCVGYPGGRSGQLADRDDDRMDELQRQLYEAVLCGDRRAENTMDVTLVGRYYERYADHAVAVARQVDFLAGVGS
ncbi:phosphate signaling complex protein PhoU [Kutzneria viridogrisea]|uniref:Phosphate-specific transport system accessory protein PhoU n=2 Tax=Kutzneria TaxID=43356 RepID=W5WFQ7_9PSEU|nr:phosphate signaling complex protein PhoU [Kutzneria albida]AHH97009.1 PhoU family transcription regulator-like protein [Kutzneria albida DSM 43870]MBA8932024.1 phosphate transport system protein [Kutzneria viridogrisea]